MTVPTRKCFKCGHEIPAAAAHCPHCEELQESRSLASKGIITIVVLIAVALLITMVAYRIYDANNTPIDSPLKQGLERK